MKCRLCGSAKIEKKISYKTPINHQYLSHPEGNDDTYAFHIFFCKSCGFIHSPKYVQSKESLYKNYFTLSSWKSQPQALQIVSRLKDFIGLPINSKIVDVGANDGTFLDLLVQEGYTDVCGIEPTMDASTIAIEKSHEIINDFLSLDLVDKHNLENKYDVVTSRHVLEHVLELDDFLQACRLMLNEGGVLILELPDHGEAIKYRDFSFWEEHVNYFTNETLTAALRKNGLEIFASEITLFTGAAQIHYIKRCHTMDLQSSPVHLELAENYLDSFEAFGHRLQEYVNDIKSKKDVVCFGAGCRLAALVNIFNLQPDISYFVDDNIDKIGKFLPMSKLEIKSSSELNKSDYHVILGVNAELEGRVIKKFLLQDYCSFLPPSFNLPTFWMRNLG